MHSVYSLFVSDMRHCRWYFHRSWHHWFLHIHCSWSVQESRAGQTSLMMVWFRTQYIYGPSLKPLVSKRQYNVCDSVYFLICFFVPSTYGSWISVQSHTFSLLLNCDQCIFGYSGVLVWAIFVLKLVFYLLELFDPNHNCDVSPQSLEDWVDISIL